MSARSRVTPAPSIGALVDAEVDAIDRLAAATRGEIRSAAHYAELEEDANAICDRLRAAFRSRRPR